MQYILENTIGLGNGKRHLEHFIEEAYSQTKQLLITELCVHPGYFAIDDVTEEIIQEKCVGCLLCVETGDFEFIDQNSVPINHEGMSLDAIASNCFKGKFYQYNNGDKFSSHTESNETKITNPIGASYLVQISSSPSAMYICSSPSNECSIQKSNVISKREGHLDISAINIELGELFILEGKKNVDGFIKDSKREQWAQYFPTIDKIAKSFEINSTFCYLIGGSEVDMYPDGIGPISRHHAMFKKVVDKDRKKFISHESLRAMKATKLTIKQDLSWEVNLLPVINRSDFVGLVTGGVIFRKDGAWVLEKAPWT